MDIKQIIDRLQDEADYQDLMIIPNQETPENEHQVGVKEGLSRSILIIKSIIRNQYKYGKK